MTELIDINNRRYLGNKYKLLSFISEVINENCNKINVIADIFSGTGAFCSLFVDKTIITNDILYSNYICNIAWFGAEKVDTKMIEKKIEIFNKRDYNENNYMTDNFSNTYFDFKNCSKIGYVREKIEKDYKKGNINNRERAILITSLIYAMDRVANTCGHYDAYIKKNKKFENVYLKMPNIYNKNKKKNKCYNMDANDLVKKIKADIVYIDPPYNSRQYSDAYHLIENVARWDKPTVYGIAKKMKRETLKSKYCTNEATDVFSDLIKNICARYVLMSYNNTGEKLNGRSNAKISDNDIKREFKKRGNLKVFEANYKYFTTGKTKKIDNKERLFLCEVTK